MNLHHHFYPLTFNCAHTLYLLFCYYECPISVLTKVSSSICAQDSIICLLFTALTISPLSTTISKYSLSIKTDSNQDFLLLHWPFVRKLSQILYIATFRAQFSTLILNDLPAAFNTIGHSLLLKHIFLLASSKPTFLLGRYLSILFAGVSFLLDLQMFKFLWT